MPYTKEISATKNLPTALILLVDQSGSMADPWGGGAGSKADAVADIVNKALGTAIYRCTKGIDVRNYFHIGAIKYSGAGAQDAFGQGLMTVSDLKPRAQMQTMRKKIYVGAGQVQEVDEEVPVWFEPDADGGTPMAEAFAMAEIWLQTWLRSYPDSFPPMIFNITDGAAGDVSAAESGAQRVMGLATSDGNVIVANCHVSESQGQQVIFPVSDAGLPDDNARLLFRMSSPMPPAMAAIGQQQFEQSVGSGARAFLYQAGPVELVNLLDIGTRVQEAQMDR